MATIEQEREIESLAKQIAEERGVPHPSLVMTEAYRRYFFDGERADPHTEEESRATD